VASWITAQRNAGNSGLDPMSLVLVGALVFQLVAVTYLLRRAHQRPTHEQRMAVALARAEAESAPLTAQGTTVSSPGPETSTPAADPAFVEPPAAPAASGPEDQPEG
jgi:hypothetical protein